MHRFRLRTAPIVAACIGGLLTVTLAPSPAHAEDVVITLPVSNITQPIQGEFVIDAGQLQSFDVDLPAQTNAMQVAEQCMDLPTIGKYCTGTPSGTEEVPLDITGGETLHPLVKWSDEARAALDWMIPEGVEHIRALNDLPSDDRIEKYARPQLRTYITGELLSIMDKKRDGQPLTDNEQNALAFVEKEYMARDRLVAQYAWDEYLHFKSDPCNYVVPAAPRSVAKPETMPKKVIDWCKLPKQQVAEFFTFVPPLPSPAQFTAWGSYRHAEEVGLNAFDRNVPLRNLVDMTKVTAAMGGVAAASAQGMLLGAGTTLASLATIGVKIFPYASRQLFHSSLEFGGQFITNLSGAASGLLATAIIAAVLVVFLVVTGVATYLLIQHESVADTLRDRVNVTTKETDPFNLVDPPPGPPNHRTKDFYFALAAQVAKWTSTYHEQAPGMPPNVVGTSPADPEGLWPGNAPDIDDPTWLIQVADAKRAVERPTLEIPHDKGFAKLRISDGWPILTPPGGQPEPALEFGYRDVNNVPVIVSGAPASRTGFIVSGAFKSGVVFTDQTRTLSFENADGEVVRARLKAPAPTYLSGPRPAAVGPMFAGRPVMLRPNPVGVQGQSLDDATVQSDYDFDWTVEKLDDVSGEWSVVPVTDGFGTSFTPTEPGEYDARVTMTSVDDPDQQRYGSVRFTVTSPPVEPLVATLIDNGSNRLELDLQLREEVPGDTFDVEVTWPSQLGEEVQPTQSIELDCTQTGPIECTTARTGDLNALVWATDPLTDVRQSIKVTATNSTGGAYEGEFVLGEGRPVIAPPPDGANAGKSGTVVVGDHSTQVTMVPTDPASNVDFVAAELVPSAGGGQGFALVSPTTGNTVASVALPQLTNGAVDVYEDGGAWYLAVRGIPDMASIGTFEVPLTVAQTNGTRQLVAIVVTVAPSVDDKYRGGIQSTIDPDAFSVDTPPDLYPVVLGGRVTDPRYTGRMCVSLDEANFPDPPVQRCGPVADFLTPAGVAKPLPYPRLFPDGLSSGPYRAEAWLATPGDRVDRRPIGVSFSLTEDASYPRPKVGMGKVAVTGKTKVTKRLRASVASTDPVQATVRYQWLRDGKAIKGATVATYRLTAKDRDHRMSVRVTATYPKWTATTKTSPRTKRIT